MKKVFTLFPLVIVVAFSLLSIVPLFSQGFFPIHDNTQVARVHQMFVALTDGMFPVRWVPDLGYGFGYPIFTFYAPLSYYLGGFLMLLGLAALPATKIMIGISMVLSGIGMFYLARQFVRDEGAVIASLLYVFVPYHAGNLYVRGAIGELYAYAFLPIALYGLYRLYVYTKPLSFALAVLGLAGVILSHNLTALMFVPFYTAVLLFLLYKSRSKKRQLIMLASVAVGLLLSSFYALPAVLEMGYTSVSSLTTGGSVFSDHFVCPYQLWSSQWGFGGSTSGCLDGMSFQIGKIHILMVAVSLIAAVFSKRLRKVILFCVVGALASVFMMTPFSRTVWDMLPPIHYLQFPWRFLQITSLFLSLLGGISTGYLLDSLSEKNVSLPVRFAVWGSVIAAILFINLKYFQPQFLINPYSDQTDKELLISSISKISDEYLPRDFVRPKEISQAARSPLSVIDAEVEILKNKTHMFSAKVTSENGSVVAINKAFFPAWTFEINNTEVMPKVEKGRYYLPLSSGESTITGRYRSTPIEKIGNGLSVIGFAGLVLGIIYLSKLPVRHAKTS